MFKIFISSSQPINKNNLEDYLVINKYGSIVKIGIYNNRKLGYVEFKDEPKHLTYQKHTVGENSIEFGLFIQNNHKINIEYFVFLEKWKKRSFIGNMFRSIQVEHFQGELNKTYSAKCTLKRLYGRRYDNELSNIITKENAEEKFILRSCGIIIYNNKSILCVRNQNSKEGATLKFHPDQYTHCIPHCTKEELNLLASETEFDSFWKTKWDKRLYTKEKKIANKHKNKIIAMANDTLKRCSLENKDLFKLPKGNFDFWHESMINAAKREVKEETKLDISIKYPIEDFIIRIDDEEKDFGFYYELFFITKKDKTDVTECHSNIPEWKNMDEILNLEYFNRGNWILINECCCDEQEIKEQIQNHLNDDFNMNTVTQFPLDYFTSLIE